VTPYIYRGFLSAEGLSGAETVIAEECGKLVESPARSVPMKNRKKIPLVRYLYGLRDCRVYGEEKKVRRVELRARDHWRYTDQTRVMTRTHILFTQVHPITVRTYGASILCFSGVRRVPDLKYQIQMG